MTGFLLLNYINISDIVLFVDITGIAIKIIKNRRKIKGVIINMKNDILKEGIFIRTSLSVIGVKPVMPLPCELLEYL